MFIGHFLAIKRKSINIKKGGGGGERGGGFIMTSRLFSSDLQGEKMRSIYSSLRDGFFCFELLQSEM